MLSLGAFRFRNVLVEQGGPIGRIDMATLPVRGRSVPIACARLRPGLVEKNPLSLYNSADGAGTDPVPSVARHKAVSEALERWAFHATARSERAADFGFDVDPSTCGMAAFPGLFPRQARRKAMLEAIERFSIAAWWEGRLAGRAFETDWPGVSAVAIDSPLGGVTVIAHARTDWGGYVYGHAAEESFSAACENAVMELARHECVMRSAWLATVAGVPLTSTNVFEQRCLYFARPEGHAEFRARIDAPVGGPPPAVDLLCDEEIPGPWSEYAAVWRFSLRPISPGYLHGGEGYFFL